MRPEELFERIKEKKEGTIHLVGEGERLNRPEDGYQPTLDAKIKYELDGSEIAEEGSIADNLHELHSEIEKILENLSALLTEEGYQCVIEGGELYFKKLENAN